jgi:hypothetical protein
MQTQTIKIDTYSINELSPEVKEQVISKNRDINVDYDGWHDFILEERKSQLESLGYIKPEILYSGFWSQGDGACFTGAVDLESWLKAHKLSNKYRSLFAHREEVSVNIKHNSHYYYSTSTSVLEDGGYYLEDKPGKQLDEVIELIESEREELGNEIYRELEKAYSSLTEDEAVVETIEANDYKFTKDGKTYINL